MKKTIIISALAIASLGLSSCDDFLNENRFPLDKQTDNPSYWNNECAETVRLSVSQLRRIRF